MAVTMPNPNRARKPKRARKPGWSGADVHRLRVLRGWTQADLADRLGVTSRLVSGWERGQYPVRRLYLKHLDALAKNPDYRA